MTAGEGKKLRRLMYYAIHAPIEHYYVILSHYK